MVRNLSGDKEEVDSIIEGDQEMKDTLQNLGEKKIEAKNEKERLQKI